MYAITSRTINGLLKNLRRNSRIFKNWLKLKPLPKMRYNQINAEFILINAWFKDKWNLNMFLWKHTNEKVRLRKNIYIYNFKMQMRHYDWCNKNTSNIANYINNYTPQIHYLRKINTFLNVHLCKIKYKKMLALINNE